MANSSEPDLDGEHGSTSDSRRLIQRHDQFAKQLLDQPGCADAFLREHLPATVTARLSAVPAVDRSETFIDPLLTEHRGDRVFALETMDGEPILVWTLIEHKSSPEPDTLIQMFATLCGITGRGARRHKEANGTVRIIPAPVYPVLLYHGTRRWTLPLSLGEAYRLPDNLVTERLPNFWYSLVDLGVIQDAELSHFPSLQAGLLVLKYATRDDDPLITLERLIAVAAEVDLTLVVLVVKYLFKASDVDRTRLRAVLKSILPGQEEDVMLTVAQEIIAEVRPRFFAEGKAEGKAEGEAKGKAEGKAEMLLRQLRRRFKTFPSQVEDRVRAAGSDQLDEWIDLILDARELADVFATDQKH
ncbi:transposase [uncultured Gammaproteobacteria bacterium]